LIMSKNDFCCKRIVVKYGGGSLADHEKISRAVLAVSKEVKKGVQVAVVVSAMGKTTDTLLTVANNACGGNIDRRELDDILAMGERTSIRLFTAILNAVGLDSRYFDPLDQDWPIITDDVFTDANPITEECDDRIKRYILPLVEKGVVPVIAGFVGRTADGRITTLGRGGSDTTAFILARALKADEVILVTDADGIMSADPKIIANPQKLPEIDVGTLVALADSGAKFIHTKALKYKDSCTNVRVISHTHGDLRENGTLITGALESELDVNIANNSPALSITIVGKGICDAPLIMQKLAEETRVHSSLIGLSVNHNSMILYAVQEGDPELLLEKIHDIVIKHKETIAMSVKLSLAFLKIHGVGLEKTPGIIGKVSDTLRTHGINIFGILTITSSILLFVDWNLKEIALNVVKESLRGGEK